jgi:glutaredoxin 3
MYEGWSTLSRQFDYDENRNNKIRRQEEAKMAEKTVTVYSTQTWPWCHRAKEYLSRKGVKFTDIDVSKDAAKAKEMMDKSHQMGVPVIIIDDKIIVGFDQKKIDTALAE